MVSNTQGAKGVKESTATLTAAVLSSITTIKDTLPPGILKSFLNGTQWDEEDLRRLGLVS